MIMAWGRCLPEIIQTQLSLIFSGSVYEFSRAARLLAKIVIQIAPVGGVFLLGGCLCLRAGRRVRIHRRRVCVDDGRYDVTLC